LSGPYPAGYGFPWPFGRAGIRFSILPSPAGDLDLPRGRLTAGVCSCRPHRALHVPHEGDAVGVGASFTPRSTVFIKAGVVHELRSACDQSSPSQPGLSMTCCSFDASQKIHLIVHPSYLHLIRVSRLVRASPWTSPAASHTSVTSFAHAPDGDGIEHYPGSVLRTAPIMRPRAALDKASVAYVLCRIEDDSSLTPSANTRTSSRG